MLIQYINKSFWKPETPASRLSDISSESIILRPYWLFYFFKCICLLYLEFFSFILFCVEIFFNFDSFLYLLFWRFFFFIYIYTHVFLFSFYSYSKCIYFYFPLFILFIHGLSFNRFTSVILFIYLLQYFDSSICSIKAFIRSLSLIHCPPSLCSFSLLLIHSITSFIFSFSPSNSVRVLSFLPSVLLLLPHSFSFSLLSFFSMAPSPSCFFSLFLYFFLHFLSSYDLPLPYSLSFLHHASSLFSDLPLLSPFISLLVSLPCLAHSFSRSYFLSQVLSHLSFSPHIFFSFFFTPALMLLLSRLPFPRSLSFLGHFSSSPLLRSSFHSLLLSLSLSPFPFSLARSSSLSFTIILLFLYLFCFALLLFFLSFPLLFPSYSP